MRHTIVNAATVLGIVALASVEPTGASAQDKLKHGEYLATIMDCGGCHTPGALAGQPDAARGLAGSNIGFQMLGVGVFYLPNLTPDPETGLGAWSERDIVTAVRPGVRPDGRVSCRSCRTTTMQNRPTQMRARSWPI